MAPDRRNLIVLSALVIILAIAVYWILPPTAGTPVPASNERGAARTTSERSATDAPDVHLESLNAERPKPNEVERNLFRFRPKPAPPPAVKAPVDPPPTPTGPPAPPALAPIALKFVAVYEVPGKKMKLAVLSDGRGGASIYGAEGDTVEGRYKILRIGNESIEMSYLDGRGRQTIRLTGQ